MNKVDFRMTKTSLKLLKITVNRLTIFYFNNKSFSYFSVAVAPNELPLELVSTFQSFSARAKKFEVGFINTNLCFKAFNRFAFCA